MSISPLLSIVVVLVLLSPALSSPPILSPVLNNNHGHWAEETFLMIHEPLRADLARAEVALLPQNFAQPSSWKVDPPIVQLSF